METQKDLNSGSMEKNGKKGTAWGDSVTSEANSLFKDAESKLDGMVHSAQDFVKDIDVGKAMRFVEKNAVAFVMGAAVLGFATAKLLGRRPTSKSE